MSSEPSNRPCFYTQGAGRRMMRDMNTLRMNSVVSDPATGPRECLHRTYCYVSDSDLLEEVRSWLTQWPAAMMVALAVAAEGARLHPGLLFRDGVPFWHGP